MRYSSLPRILTAFLLALSTSLAAPAHAGPGSKPAKGDKRTIIVLHGPATTRLVTAGSSGHALGDLRVLPAKQTYDPRGVPLGHLDAQLLTTSVDYPNEGDEVRMTVLNFVFGEGDGYLAGSPDQIIVSGSGYYPLLQGTIASGLQLVRPIIGGSGRYAGAAGSAISEHLGDDSWRHTLQLLKPGQR